MATKFADFIKEKNIDPRRILVASAEIERFLPADRAIKLARTKARKSEDKKKEGLALQKPRSGRPVTDRSLQAALGGTKSLAGPQKTRLLRAVNKVLEWKKQDAVELGALFEPTPRPKKIVKVEE